MASWWLKNDPKTLEGTYSHVPGLLLSIPCSALAAPTAEARGIGEWGATASCMCRADMEGEASTTLEVSGK